MTDPSSTPDRDSDYARIMLTVRAQQAKRSELRLLNKAALFDALEGASITRVVVDFDGCGDSGQIEFLDADGIDGSQVVLPEDRVPYRSLVHLDEEPRTIDHTVREAIEAMVYDCLEETHPGWENDDGADGSFVFEVANRDIRLEHNQRFLTTTSYEHEF